MNKVNWYISKCYLWGRSLSHWSQKDQILAGFPKTGSTWVRYFLYTLLNQEGDYKEKTIDAMNSALPEFANESFFKVWQFKECARIVKTHQKRLPLFRRNKVALIVRDPRDIVVSYYHYASGLKSADFSGGIFEALRHRKLGAKAFFQHYATWVEAADIILRYEDLKDEPFLGFSKLASFFGIERSPEQIQRAIEAANFSNMRIAQGKSANLKSEFKDGHQFVRSGKKGQWQDLFTEADVQYYESLKAKYAFDLYE